MGVYLLRKEIDMEVCALCRETLRDCLCWRCMDCETLQWDDADYYESDTGEMVCADCWDA